MSRLIGFLIVATLCTPYLAVRGQGKLSGVYEFDAKTIELVEKRLTDTLDEKAIQILGVDTGDPAGVFARVLIEKLFLDYSRDEVVCRFRIAAAPPEKAGIVSEQFEFVLLFSPHLSIGGDVERLSTAVNRTALADGLLRDLQIKVAPEAGVAFAKLPVLSMPEGAEVTIDGESYRPTNCTVHLRVRDTLTVKVQVTLGGQSETFQRVLKRGEEAEPCRVEFEI